MGHHINEQGKFQSDKYPDLPPNKIILSFKDPEARKALEYFGHLTKDQELGEDILEVLTNNSMIKQIQKSKEEAFDKWCGESDINLNDFLDKWQKRMIVGWHIQQQILLLEEVKHWAEENKKKEFYNKEKWYNQSLEDLIIYIDEQIKG